MCTLAIKRVRQAEDNSSRTIFRFSTGCGKLIALLTTILLKFWLQDSVSNSKGDHCFCSLADAADIASSRSLVAILYSVESGWMTLEPLLTVALGAHLSETCQFPFSRCRVDTAAPYKK